MQTTKRILLVDDDVDDQFLFCEALKELHSHIDCVIANDGAEALRLIEEIPELDVIFLDLNMPRVDGFECLIHIRDSPLHKHIPVIILSTTNRVEDADRCRCLGATRFVSKPTTFEELSCQLRNILTGVIKESSRSSS